MNISAQDLMVLVQRLPAQGKRYVKSLIWLVRDSIDVAPRPWLRIVAATLLNLASNAGVAGAIYTYVDLLQRNAQFNFLGFSVVVRQSEWMLSIFIGIMTIAMLGYAASEYITKAAALTLHRDYRIYSLRRAVELLQRLPDARCPQAAGLVATSGARSLIVAYPHSSGWSLRFIGVAFPNLVLFVAGFSALLWLDAGMTFLVTCLGLGVIAAQYPIHLLAARSSNVFEETNAYVSEQLRGLIEGLSAATGEKGRRSIDARLNRYLKDPRVCRNSAADIDRFRSMELSALSMQTGGAIVLAALLVIIGNGLLSDDANWAVLLVYVTLLRRLLNSVTAVFRTVSVFSRFSPHIQIYRNFVEQASLAASPAPVPAHVPEQLAFAISGGDGDRGVLRVHRGARLAVFSRNQVDRDLAMMVQLALYEGRQAGDRPVAAIRAVASSEADSADTFEVAMKDAVDSGAAIVLVDQRSFAALTDKQRRLWLDRLAGRYAAFTYAAGHKPKFGETIGLIRDRGDSFHAISLSGVEDFAPTIAEINRVLSSGRRGASATQSLDEDMG